MEATQQGPGACCRVNSLSLARARQQVGLAAHKGVNCVIVGLDLCEVTLGSNHWLGRLTVRGNSWCWDYRSAGR